MEKSFVNRPCINLFYYIICGIFLYAGPLLATCECDFPETPDICYEDLGKYEPIFREFEQVIEMEDVHEKRLFFVKWCHHAKRWFKHRIARQLKNMVHTKHIRNMDDAALEFIRFKRSIDRHLYNTGDIETCLARMDNHVPKDKLHLLDKFKERVRYHWYKKHHLHSSKDMSPCDESQNSEDIFDKKCYSDLDNIPIRSLVGGVEIACGALIAVIPFPGCLWLGGVIAAHGFANCVDGYIQRLD